MDIVDRHYHATRRGRLGYGVGTASMVVYVNENPDGLDLTRALASISPERRAYALRYRQERDRRLSVAAYLLLKDALKREYGLDGNPRLARGVHGKPYLPDRPDIHFSFSHCAKAAVCVVSDAPVGVDVEAIAPVDWAVARRVLSEDELADVRSSPDPEIAFARHWTRKEALVKLTGDGIADEGALAALPTETPGVRVETSVHRPKGYVMTVAVNGQG